MCKTTRNFSNSLVLPLIFSFFLLYASGYSQIVLESNEYNITFGAQFQLYFAEDTTGNGYTVDVGTTGGPQSWNFMTEQFPGGNAQDFTIVDPTTTPFADDFPLANHAWFSFDEGEAMDMYNYFNLTETALFELGMGFSATDSSMVIVNTPAETLVVFPATLNTSWSSDYSNRFTAPGDFEIVDSTSTRSTIDAWGTVEVPAGTYECLRIRSDVTEFTFSYEGGVLVFSDTSSHIEYLWVAENVGLVVNMTSLDGEIDPNFTQAHDVTIRMTDIVGIGEEEAVLSGSFKLYQNFPNPFNPSTKISYSIPRSGMVTLKVYDMLGREIHALVNNFQQAGTYSVDFDATSLASGIYFYQLQLGNLVEKRKMLLMR